MASINYNDNRFKDNTKAENKALNEVDVTYGNMINQSDKYYDKQIDAVEDYGEKQIENANKQTDFAIEKIEQQKEQTKKDYTKEQAGAYVDWQKASDPYGAEAEKVAASGLSNSGYADSLETQKYVAYQNRVATARETYNKAVLEYDNMIKDARLQNSALLAEIAYNTLQKKLELSLQGFQYKNTLILEKANKKREIKNDYYKRYSDIVNQINTENALAEEKRQYNENLKLNKEQLAESKRHNKAVEAENKRQFDATMAYNKSKSSGSVSSKKASSSKKSSSKKSSSKKSSGGSIVTSKVTKNGKDPTFNSYSAANKYLEKN